MAAMSGAPPHRFWLTLAVEVDPVAHGFDLPPNEGGRVILAAIDNARGLQVAEAYAVESTSRIASPGGSRVQ